MPGVTTELARRLLASGAVATRDVEAALYLSVVRGVSLPRALVDRGLLSERALEEELGRKGGLPVRQVAPDPDLAARLPVGMCRMLAAVPLREDPSGVIEIVAVDPLDTHVASEFSFHLGVPVRVLRATMAGIEEAVRRLELAEGAPTTRSRHRTPASPHGAPDTVPPSAPPPSEEVPIPLVRRLHPGGISRALTEELLGASASLPPDPETKRPPPASRRPSFRDLPLGAPVSFPSQPPPGQPSEDAAMETLPPSRRAFAASLGELFPDGALAEAEDARGGAAAEPPTSLLVGEDEPTPLESLAPAPIGPEPLSARAPDAGWSPTLPELRSLIRRAPSRDELLDLVLRALTLIANRAAIFVLRKDHYRGWLCNPAFGSEEELREVSVPAELPSVLATAAAAGFYLGPIPRTPGHLPILAVMRTATPDVAVYVARVKRRPTLLLVADELDDTLLGTRAISEIADSAGESLARILAAR